MTNNDVLRRLRYTFNLRDAKVVDIFNLVGVTVTPLQVQQWLLKDDDDNMVEIQDVELACFLNGFIIEKRGKKDEKLPTPEKTLTKNLILMKLKIALSLQNDDIIRLLATTGFTVGKSELSAFFRKPDHKNYRHCKSQFLRNFLQAVQDTYRVEVKKHAKQKSAANISPNKTQVKASSSSKQRYINPNSKNTPKESSRKVLKLKPEDIYKNS